MFYFLFFAFRIPPLRHINFIQLFRSLVPEERATNDDTHVRMVKFSEKKIKLVSLRIFKCNGNEEEEKKNWEAIKESLIGYSKFRKIIIIHHDSSAILLLKLCYGRNERREKCARTVFIIIMEWYKIYFNDYSIFPSSFFMYAYFSSFCFFAYFYLYSNFFERDGKTKNQFSLKCFRTVNKITSRHEMWNFGIYFYWPVKKNYLI